ncbi:MAG: YIP1 family protein [Rudaea sp.]
MQNRIAMGQHSVIDRIVGVLTLKAPIYREIADDETATSQAAAIVVVMAVLTAAIGAALVGAFGSALPQGFTAAATSPVNFFIRTVISNILNWLIGAWVIAFVSTTFFGGKTNMWEMARVFGYTQIFTIIAVIPCLGWIVGIILSLIGAVIGIREASEFDTTKAILTAVVAFIAVLIVGLIIGTLLGLVGLS